MELLEKAWKDKKLKIQWKRQEARNSENSLPIKTNAASTESNLSNNSSIKRDKRQIIC